MSENVKAGVIAAIAAIVITVCGAVASAYFVGGQIEQHLDDVDRRLIRIEQKVDELSIDVAELDTDVKWIKSLNGRYSQYVEEDE